MPDEGPRGWPEGFATRGRDRAALLVLASLRGLTPRRLHALAWCVGSASSCLEAVRARRSGSARDAEWADRLRPQDIQRRLDRLGVRAVVPGSPEYVDALEDLPDPPAALFVRGRALPTLDPAVAIVGARRCSALGADVARSLASRVAGSGVCVVSGAARGVDRASHEGALSARGPTMAVLGCGVDRASSEALRLLRRIEYGAGAIVTEYPPGVGASRRNFPARNRLIAALARGVVIVEGRERSGTLITTDHALSMGREVFAVPGPITNPLSDVPNALIRDGATLIRGVGDIMAELGLEAAAPPPEPALEGDEHAVFASMTSETLAETLAAATRLPTARVSAALTTLEMKGLVRCVGGRYQRRPQA